jgi:hypothetical protein
VIGLSTTVIRNKAAQVAAAPRRLVQRLCGFALYRTGIMTADQPHQFLRVHLMAVIGMLL